MFISINIGNGIEAMKFIQRNDVNIYKDIYKDIKKLMKESNETSIFIYEDREYNRINSLNKCRKAYSKDKYIEYIGEHFLQKPMTYLEFVKANYSEDYIDFSFNSHDEYNERVKEKIEEIGKSNNLEGLSPTDYYYKDKIKDYSIDVNWSQYISDNEINVGNNSFYYIDELIEGIIKKYDIKVYLYYVKRNIPQFIIGWNIQEETPTLSFLENFRKENIEQIEYLKKLFDDDNLEIKVFSKRNEE